MDAHDELRARVAIATVGSDEQFFVRDDPEGAANLRARSASWIRAAA